MPQYILYAYVDGSDLDDVAATLDAEFVAFVASRKWVAGAAWTVNQRDADGQFTQPGDLPRWDLGLNLELPNRGHEASGWFSDVEAIAQFLGRLHAAFGRDFTIGIADANTGISEDLLGVTTPSPDLRLLKAIIGVGEAE